MQKEASIRKGEVGSCDSCTSVDVPCITPKNYTRCYRCCDESGIVQLHVEDRIMTGSRATIEKLHQVLGGEIRRLI